MFALAQLRQARADESDPSRRETGLLGGWQCGRHEEGNEGSAGFQAERRQAWISSAHLWSALRDLAQCRWLTASGAAHGSTSLPTASSAHVCQRPPGERAWPSALPACSRHGPGVPTRASPRFRRTVRGLHENTSPFGKAGKQWPDVPSPRVDTRHRDPCFRTRHRNIWERSWIYRFTTRNTQRDCLPRTQGFNRFPPEGGYCSPSRSGRRRAPPVSVWN
jgi:hypothetical protein